MASFSGHITASALCGVAYGAAASMYWQLDWGLVFLGAGLTTLGGMLPDLDSDSGIPVRELSSLAATTTPILLLPRLRNLGFTPEQTLVVLAGIYLFIRYVMAEFFKRVTVHRGMYHSIPAMLIAGLIVFLLYDNNNLRHRVYLAVGMMVGFLSHLILDEVCAVDLNGVVPKLNAFAGSALKLTSKSWVATGITYMILLALAYSAWITTETKTPGGLPGVSNRPASLPPLRTPPG